MDIQDMNVDSQEAYEEENEFCDNKCVKCNKCYAPPMKVRCDLEITVGYENKIIYVCPNRLQYFTVKAICCANDKTIEIEYCGNNTKCIGGEPVICGRLGYYKIVNSGIVFMPYRKIPHCNNEVFPSDILSFRVRGKDLQFEVIFTYAKCEECSCNKECY